MFLFYILPNTNLCCYSGNHQASQQNKRVSEYQSTLLTKACFRASWHLQSSRGVVSVGLSWVDSADVLCLRESRQRSADRHRGQESWISLCLLLLHSDVMWMRTGQASQGWGFSTHQCRSDQCCPNIAKGRSVQWKPFPFQKVVFMQISVQFWSVSTVFKNVAM